MGRQNMAAFSIKISKESHFKNISGEPIRSVPFELPAAVLSYASNGPALQPAFKDYPPQKQQ